MEAFDFKTPYPEPYIPKALTFEIPERITVDGSVKVPLDEAATIAVLRRACRTRGRGGRGLLPVVDRQSRRTRSRSARLIEKHLPGVPYTLSHRINPSIREYRRAMLDLHRRVAEAGDERLSRRAGGKRLRDAGFGGRVLIVTSQGGVMDAALDRRGAGPSHQFGPEHGAGRRARLWFVGRHRRR